MEKAVISLFSVLMFGLSCAQNQPQIDYVITNDYMSERTLSYGPIPADYDKSLIDNLSNCFVEHYNNKNVVRINIIEDKIKNCIPELKKN